MATKAVILDIETSSLEADAGVVVGAGLMPEKGQAEYFPVRRTGEEKNALLKLVEHLQDFDLVVTWNGRFFDIPFLTTRLLSHNLDPRPIATMRHVDLNEVVKNRLKLTFTYLDHVCTFFGIEKKRSTMGMDVPRLYVRALEGDRRALGLIREHCLDDLQATRRVYLRLKPLLEGFLA
jgi:uncharacterized protein YprB with RNaseH-like and TPR domain